MQEECRGWDVSEVIFTPAMWSIYQSVMRADFTLFDSYTYTHAGKRSGLVDTPACSGLRAHACIACLLQDGSATLKQADAPTSAAALLTCSCLAAAAAAAAAAAGEAKFSFPVHAFYGTKDRRISRQMVEGWAAHTTGAFQLTEIEGHHLWPLVKESKAHWLQLIVEDCQRL